MVNWLKSPFKTPFCAALSLLSVYCLKSSEVSYSCSAIWDTFCFPTCSVSHYISSHFENWWDVSIVYIINRIYAIKYERSWLYSMRGSWSHPISNWKTSLHPVKRCMEFKLKPTLVVNKPGLIDEGLRMWEIRTEISAIWEDEWRDERMMDKASEWTGCESLGSSSGHMI